MIDTGVLRNKVLALAFQGKLTEQTDENAHELFIRVCEERDSLIKQKVIKKNKTKDITNEDLKFTIPSNWIWVRLGDVINLQSGQDLTTSDYNDQVAGVPYITGASNFRTDESLIINRWTETPKAIALENDILLSVKGTVGKLAFLYEEKVHIARQIMGIRPIGLNRKYVKFFVQEQVEELKAISKGLIPGIERDNVLNMLMPMPPLSEQELIVEQIEEAFAKLNVIDELQQRYSSDIEVLKSKIIDAGIQGKLTEQLPEDGTAEELLEQITEEKNQLIKEKKIKKEKSLEEISKEEIPFEIPDNWKWVRLADVCSKISSGNTPAGGSKGGAYVTEGYCFFREQNIYNDGIHYDGMVYITEELLATRENSTVLPQDILLNITGGSIGRCALIPDDFSKGSINQHILIIRVINPDTRQFIHNCLCSPYYKKIIMGNVVGDKDGFSAGRCKNTLIPLPPISEQKRIVNRISQIYEQI